MDSIDVMREYGISTSTGQRAFSGEEAARVAAKLSMFLQGAFFHSFFLSKLLFFIPSFRLSTATAKKVVKAQVLAGGRGKGHFDNGFQGGVHIVNRCVEKCLEENEEMKKKEKKPHVLPSSPCRCLPSQYVSLSCRIS